MFGKPAKFTVKTKNQSSRYCVTSRGEMAARSTYEELREANILRNSKILTNLGIDHDVGLFEAKFQAAALSSYGYSETNMSGKRKCPVR